MEYFDYFGATNPLPITGEAPLALTKLAEIFGFDLKLSESERRQILEFLGSMSGQLPDFLRLGIGEGGIKGSACGDSGVGKGLAGRPPKAGRGTLFCPYVHYGKDCSGHDPPAYIPTNSGVAPKAFFPSAIPPLDG